MESKTFARIGAIAFVAVAITMTALEMREAPKPAPTSDVVTVMEPDGDPLPAILSYCASIGEAGAHDRQCLDAWAENRRRFLSPQSKSSTEHIDPAPVMPFADQAANEAVPVSEGAN